MQCRASSRRPEFPFFVFLAAQLLRNLKSKERRYADGGRGCGENPFQMPRLRGPRLLDRARAPSLRVCLGQALEGQLYPNSLFHKVIIP